MSKYLKNDSVTINSYKNELNKTLNKTSNEIVSDIRGNIEKKYLLCSQIENIFGEVQISNEAMDSLVDMYTLKEIKEPNFREELIKAYPLVMTYPKLLPSFVKELLPFYNARMFEELDLFSYLDKAMETKLDSDFDLLISKAVVAKLKYDDKWKNASSILDIYKDTYSVNYIEYLKKIAIKEYIDYSSIIVSMPSPELIRKDEQLAFNIDDLYRTNTVPLSYELTISYANHEDLSMYEDLFYNTLEGKIMASFNLEDYLNDVRKKTLVK